MDIVGKITQFFSQKRPEDQPEVYLALQIDHTSVKAATWRLVDQKVAMLGTGKASYPENDWERAIDAADTAIADAMAECEIEIPKVMFGLPEHWVSEERIHEPYFSHIKKFAKELDLKPLAFVAIPEAIAHARRLQEGTPITAILVGVYEKEVSVALVRVGRLEGVKEVPRSGEGIGFDTEQALQRFSYIEVFPPRLIVYGDERFMEEAKSSLSSYPWMKKSSFIHVPKLEILVYPHDIEAIACAGGVDLARRLGKEVVGTGFIPTREEKEPMIETGVTHPLRGEMPKEQLEELGFVHGTDIADTLPKKVESEPAPEESIEEPVSFSSFPEEGRKVEIPEVIEDASEMAEPVKPSFQLPRFRLPRLSIKRKSWMYLAGIAAGMFLLLGGLFAAYWYIPKAEVKLLVEPKMLTHEENIRILASDTSVDKEKKQIPGRMVEVFTEGGKKGVATGKKVVGEKAKGRVTIYNKTANPKTFQSQDVLIGPQNLKFQLEESITIASYSATLEGLTFGRADATVVASDIGTSYNISQGQDFVFKDYSSTAFTAHNDTAFAGGTSREVTVVSEEDQNRLVEVLTSELKNQGKDSLKGQLQDKEMFIPESVVETIVKREFDKKVGDEAKEVNVQVEIKTSALVFSETNLHDLLGLLIEGTIPQGYDFKKEEVTQEFEAPSVDMEEKLVQLKVKFTAQLVPHLDEGEWKGNLAGKNETIAEDYLNRQPQLAGFEFRIWPKLPSFLRTLPRIPGNIKIEVAPR